MKKAHGFTIIELLSVIVIIAILSTISLVMYNGIQDRAKNADIASTFDSYEKALMMYTVDNGRFPLPNDVSGMPGNGTGWWAICLGNPTDYPLTSTQAAGSCSKGSVLNLAHQGDVMTSANLMSMLSPYLGSKVPSVRALTADRQSGYQIRGIIYTPWYSDGKSMQIEYELYGKTSQCPRGSGNSGYFADGVRCSKILTL